ncbi:MAG: class IV adenylate cyclase [Desulfovibrionales bacterium]|nr:class IV adenylate cyclase [Desulfovibrionales bacterium]
MAYEIEVKYMNVDFSQLREKLSAFGGLCKGRHLERNVVFDTPAREMKNADRLLRLRTQQWKTHTDTVLTLKLPPAEPVPSDVKIYDERETKVESFDGTYAILEGLGYDGAFRYDKVREEWELSGVVVCLDELSFSRVVELEGDREAILQLASRLELPKKDASTATYHELHRAYLAANNLPQADSFYFTDDECQAYRQTL